MTQQQRSQVERAMELAKKAGHKVYTGHSRQTGETVYTVKSRSEQNTFHILYIAGGRIHCDCYASQHDHICSHAGAVRLFLIAQRVALASIERHERDHATAPLADTSYAGSIFKPEGARARVIEEW